MSWRTSSIKFTPAKTRNGFLHTRRPYPAFVAPSTPWNYLNGRNGASRKRLCKQKRDREREGKERERARERTVDKGKREAEHGDN